MHDIFKKGNYVDNPYKSFFDIKARDLNKNMIHMNQFYKNILLIVNISPVDKNLKDEYEKLIQLKESYKDENFEIFDSCKDAERRFPKRRCAKGILIRGRIWIFSTNCRIRGHWQSRTNIRRQYANLHSVRCLSND